MKDSIIPLFPIPISRIIVPNKLASIIPFLDSQEMNSDDPNKEGLKNYGSDRDWETRELYYLSLFN